MATYSIQAPDGKTYQIDGPGGATDDQVRAAVLAQHPDAGKAVPFSGARPERGPVGQTADAVGGFLKGAGETALTLGSGLVAGPVAGVAGVGQAANNVGREVLGLPVTTTAADQVDNAERALTYQPRSRGGQEAVEAITYPLRKLAGYADQAGEFVSQNLRSPALGAATNAGIQMLPALIEPGLRAGRAALKPIEAPAAAGSPAPGAAAPPAGQAATRARDYATSRLGVDWDSLSQPFKETLTSIATDAKKLDALPVEAVKRQAQLQSLRVPVTTTAAKLTRDATALRNEANVAATNTGKPIRDTDIQTNRDLRANVEGLRTQVGGVGKTRATAGDEGTSATAEGVGSATQKALRAKAKVSQQNYDALYKKARETEPDAEVSAGHMYDYLKKNPEVQHLGWLNTWLNKAAKSKLTKEQIDAGEVPELDQVKLAELDDLRKKAGGIRAGGGTDAHYAGEIIKAIDESFKEIPAASKAWREARDAFSKHKDEFEDTNAVERLVGNKSKNDPNTALEDTWKKSVQTAKIEEIRQLKRSLLSGGSAETRLAGKKALRELRQETVNQYLQYITRKTGTNEAGETQITAVQMVEGLKHIGGEARLKEILGERAVKELKQIIEAAKIAKTEPTIRTAGSSTLQNILAFAEKWIDKVPKVGGPIVGTIRTLGKVGEIGEDARTVRDALKQPTDPAAKSIKSKILRNQAQRAAAQGAKGILRSGAYGRRFNLRDDTDMGE